MTVAVLNSVNVNQCHCDRRGWQFKCFKAKHNIYIYDRKRCPNRPDLLNYICTVYTCITSNLTTINNAIIHI